MAITFPVKKPEMMGWMIAKEKLLICRKQVILKTGYTETYEACYNICTTKHTCNMCTWHCSPSLSLSLNNLTLSLPSPSHTGTHARALARTHTHTHTNTDARNTRIKVGPNFCLASARRQKQKNEAKPTTTRTQCLVSKYRSVSNNRVDNFRSLVFTPCFMSPLCGPCSDMMIQAR